jgi:hypothetical protein
MGKPKRSRPGISLLRISIAVAVVCTPFVFIFFWGVPFFHFERARDIPLTFSGSSKHLQSTQIVPTLDTPIEPGKNVIWCATFAAAVKKLERDVLREPLTVDGAATLTQRLAAAPDPAADMPEEDCYVAAGTSTDDILNTIRREMTQRFPAAQIPEFPVIEGDYFVCFSHLDTQAPFKLPYNDSTHPLEFHSGDGTTATLQSFGIERDDHFSNRLRQQVDVLYARGMTDGPRTKIGEFALDLCRSSSPNQIVVAKLKRQPTLAKTLEAVESRIGTPAFTRPTQDQDKALFHLTHEQLEFGDTLQVPNIHFLVEHTYTELYMKRISNAGWENSIIADSYQSIEFLLDRHGARVASTASVAIASIANKHFTLDGPFLIYIKMRDVERPFFVMWVENAELLQKWSVK